MTTTMNPENKFRVEKMKLFFFLEKKRTITISSPMKRIFIKWKKQMQRYPKMNHEWTIWRKQMRKTATFNALFDTENNLYSHQHCRHRRLTSAPSPTHRNAQKKKKIVRNNVLLLMAIDDVRDIVVNVRSASCSHQRK